MFLTDLQRNISSSVEMQSRFRRSTSPSLTASQVITRIVLSNIGVSTEKSLVPYLSSPSSTSLCLTTPTNPTSSSVETLCSICLQAMDQEHGDLYTVRLCTHVYHKRCISQWKKYSTKCPCCRGPLSDELGLTFSRLQNFPAEEALPDMTRDGVLENIIFGAVGCVWPICLVFVFLVFEVAAFAIFVVLTFFMAIIVFFHEESRSTSRLCLLIVLSLVFPPAVVVLVVSFILQIFYVLYRTVAFYGNVFMCRMRWSSANKFIITRTVSLVIYVFDWLNEI